MCGVIPPDVAVLELESGVVASLVAPLPLADKPLTFDSPRSAAVGIVAEPRPGVTSETQTMGQCPLPLFSPYPPSLSFVPAWHGFLPSALHVLRRMVADPLCPPLSPPGEEDGPSSRRTPPVTVLQGTVSKLRDELASLQASVSSWQEELSVQKSVRSQVHSVCVFVCV